MNLDASEARAAKNIARSFRQRVTRGAHIFLLPFYYRKFLLGSPLLVAHDQQGVGALGPFIPPPPPPSSRHTIFFFSSSRKMLTIEISNWSRLGQRQSGDVIAAVASHQHLRQQPKLKRIGPLDCSIRTRFFAPSNDPGRLCAMLPPLCAKLRAPVALASPTACPDCWNYGRDGTRPITASSLLPPVTR